MGRATATRRARYLPQVAACAGAVSLRLALLLYGLYQDKVSRVRFTDVDYDVFTDAAKLVVTGRSPYEQTTYRYTPLLAWLLTPNVFVSPFFGKVLFAVIDVLVGYLQLQVLRRAGNSKRTSALLSSLWLLNPLAAVVACRGNAEPLVVLFVMCSLSALQRSRPLAGGLWFGLAVHAKMYPITYALPVALYLSQRHKMQDGVDSLQDGVDSLRGDTGEMDSGRVCRKGRRGFIRLLQRGFAKVLQIVRSLHVWTFFLAAASVFIGLACLFYQMYGWEFLDQAYLYHITRRDTRHNFSPYFYLLYLGAGSHWERTVGLAALVPQAILLLIASFAFYNDLPFCFFLHTYIFVSFNKVCTSQYFLWYMCLLPLVLPSLRLPWKKGLLLLMLWFSGQPFPGVCRLRGSCQHTSWNSKDMTPSWRSA
uniref:GPI mannosyltransferase 1 isoform X2 n=1 Tax=Myxine glutinosa TaxID=7769 RepID=UPI00358F6671